MIETSTQVRPQTKSTVVPFRVKPDEFDLVVQQARQDRQTVSEWVRRVILREVSPAKGSSDD